MLKGKIKGLGEIVIRVNNMETMTHFYHDVIGLEIIRNSNKFSFFKIAEGHAGHHQTLALFHTENPNAFDEKLEHIDIKKSGLHHFALEILKDDYEQFLLKCKEYDLEFTTEIFPWINWKSIFIKDPEGNIVEFVCYDKDITE